MAKKVELGQSGLGDVSDILHNRGLSDLSWLDVDSEDYHKAEALPKQNLDAIPELQRALTYEEGKLVPSLIPLRPHTVVNTNPLDPPGTPARNMAKEIVNRVARYVMSGLSPKQVGEKILLEFSPVQVRAASDRISSVMAERGLLGNVYVDARHFPRCAQDSDDKRFVAARATSAKYILAKDECAGCVHNREGVCANLHKQLIETVSYNRKNFAHFAMQLASQGRIDKGSLDAAISGSDDDRRSFLAAGFRASPAELKRGGLSGLTLRHHDKQVKPAATEQQMAAVLARPRQAAPTISRAFVAAARHLMLGGHPDVVAASPDPEARKLTAAHGVIGHTYLDMDALGGCNKTFDFISRMDAIPDFVVRRASCCSECKDASDGACAQIRSMSSIVAAPEINREHFVAALLRASDRGAITIEAARRAASKAPKKSNWLALTAQANLLQAKEKETAYRGARVSAHYGASIPERDRASVAAVDAEEVRRTVSHMMNTGLCGKPLRNAILSRYSREDLAGVSHIGAGLAKADGVQGLYFIDPTAYPDYGRGCSIGSKRFRKIGAPNLFVGDNCVGCSMQTAPGWCAKYAKPLIRQVPASVIASAAEARARKPVQDSSPVENPVETYQLSASVDVEPNKRLSLPEVGFSDRSVTK